MKFINLSQREKKAAIVLLVITVCCVVFNLVIYPAIGRWQRLRKEVRETEVKMARVQLALKLKQRIDAEYESCESQILAKGSDEEEIAEVLQEMEKVAREVGLRILTIRPLPVEKQSFYKKHTINISAEGNVMQIGKFLHSLETSEQLLGIERLQISSRPATEILRVSLLVGKILVRPEKTQGDTSSGSGG